MKMLIYCTKTKPYVYVNNCVLTFDEFSGVPSSLVLKKIRELIQMRELTEREQVLYDELIMYINIYVVSKSNRTNLINILDDLIEEVMKNDQEGKTEN